MFISVPQSQTEHAVTKEELITIITKSHKWKAPGIEHILNFWYKNLTSIHYHLSKLINDNLRNPHKIPDFLTEGKIYIKSKNSEKQNPANYRYVICLPTLHNITKYYQKNKKDVENKVKDVKNN